MSTAALPSLALAADERPAHAATRTGRAAATAGGDAAAVRAASSRPRLPRPPEAAGGKGAVVDPGASHLDPDAAYLAWATRDARFDGRLFAGVTSTGIYCRPVCRVRLPRRDRLRFYANAASAERDGFRPCLRCRPELAPGLSLVDSPRVLAQHAARMMEHAVRAGEPLPPPEVARRLGVTDRHLRRIFQQTLGVTPIDYLTTQRLLLAKQLLTDTPLPVAQVALLSGYESVRRFNAVFRERCRLVPSALRRETAPATLARRPRGEPPPLRLPDVERCDALRLRLGYRPPYDIDGMMAFLARRQVEGLERVEPVDGAGALRWMRTLALRDAAGERPGWLVLQFRPERHEVEVLLAPALAARLGLVVEAVRQSLDLDADPALIEPALAGLPPGRPGVRVPGAVDGFEAAVRVILGQQVTTAAARTFTSRLVARFGTPVETPWRGLSRLFPSAATLAAADPAALGALGIVRQRVAALQALAMAVAAGRLALHRGAPLEPTLQALRALPGVGEWTVQLIAMRALAWPDAWPIGDVGLHLALGTRDPKRAAELAAAWRPWRAYAVVRLWQTLETQA
jgi:AraC family transcriptional regulator of adaptative response / DNA-3-methyladenine glycosylase II